MRAQIITNHKEHYFVKGAEACGYEVTGLNDNYEPRSDDILVTWNRKPSNINKIQKYERAGARVFIAENGYIGTDKYGDRLIALALNHHLGAGQWPIGDEERWKQQNINIQHWRSLGEELIILAQRGIGESKDLDWAEDLRRALKGVTNRPIRVRPHPGKNKSPLEPDLENAHAVITWSSGAAIHAIAYGVPCFYLMPNWIGAPAAIEGVGDIEKVYRGKRDVFIHRIGWAQWSAEEIKTGNAFRAFG